MKPSKESIELLSNIIEQNDIKTFHHHYHIIFDVLSIFPDNDLINYLEIGCYAGGSSCLSLQRKNTNVYSIDIGKPIPKSIVYENVKKCNIHENIYKYFEGNSNNINIINQVFMEVKKVDVFFIDGDHSYNGVINDFENYKYLLAVGSYVIFDDYLDEIYSPKVRSAVDFLCEKHKNKITIIGSLPNLVGAKPDSFKFNNCFIIKINETFIIDSHI